MIRHTSAPDTGQEFTNVRLDDCSTQRLLSEKGRREAEQLGREYRRARVNVARVLSSQWCRCLDTARLAFGEMTEPWRPLNTFHNVPSREPGQSSEVRGIIRGQAGRDDVVVMVTHWQNIEAIVGFKAREGETVVVRANDQGAIEVLGRVRPPRA
ncbi:MAG: histidine phosphatase family protein [Pseudomonadota bacterium]